MAGYQDNPTTFGSFNPYIQQLPVSQMAEVGMRKQTQYNEGVQRIQASIDNVAGLDVIRDIDKQYLQSKLDELGNNLKTVAAGDFSNFQLVNSTGGMVNQIAKDPTVLNAVGSTSAYRKQVAQMQNDITAGKASPANNFRFNKRANEWLSSKELNKSFNASYMPPIDVWAKIKDIAKEVGIDEQDIQQIYQTDERGNVLRDPKTNEPVWNPIMAEKILKGKDAGKILMAFQNALTPADYEQLAIDGEYSKAGHTPEMLKQEILSSSKEQLDFIHTKEQELKIALLQETEKNSKDVERIASLNSQLDYFKKTTQNIENSVAKSLELAESNPDTLRASLYTNNYITEMSKRLSSQEISTKFSVSPKFTVTMELNRFNRDIQRDKIADYHWSVEQKFKEQRALTEDEQFKLKMWAEHGIGAPPAGTIREGIPVEDIKNVKDIVEGDYAKGVEQLNSTNYAITLEYYKKLNSKQPNETKEEYDVRVKKLIEKDAAQSTDVNGKSLAITPSGEGVNEYTARLASKQIAEWSVDEKSISPEYRGLIEEQDKMAKSLAWKKSQMEDIKRRARQQAKEQGLEIPTDEELKNKMEEVVITLPETQTSIQKSLKLSKQDVIDFARIHPNMFNFFGNVSTDKKQVEEREKAEKRLRTKYPNDFRRLEVELYQMGEGPSILGKSLDISLGAHPAIKKAAKLLSMPNFDALNKIESELYIKEGMVKQPTAIPVLRGKDPMDDRNSRVSSVIDKYSVNDVSDYDKDELQKMLLSDPDAAVKLTAYPGVGEYSETKYFLEITPSKGGETKGLYIDANDYKMIAKSDAPVNTTTPLVINKLEKDGTTNQSEDGDPSGAYFNNNSFRNFKNANFTITGDLVGDKFDKNKVWLKIYVYDKKTKQPEILTYPEFFTKTNSDGSYNQNLDRIPMGINEEVLKQIRNK